VSGKHVKEQGPGMGEACRLSVEFDILTGHGRHGLDFRDTDAEQDSLALHRLPLICQCGNPLDRASPGSERSTVPGKGLKARNPAESIKEIPLRISMPQSHLLRLAVDRDE
jgi:hypothetical protein